MIWLELRRLVDSATGLVDLNEATTRTISVYKAGETRNFSRSLPHLDSAMFRMLLLLLVSS